MFDFFKKILGIPSNDSGRRSDDFSRNDLRNDFRDPIWGSDDYEDDDEDFRSRHGGIHSGFGFPVFTDPIEIHRYFEGVMDEMLKSFGMFGLNRPGIGWEDEGNPGDGILPFNRIEEAPKNRESIRDAYLKPGYSQKDKREDVNLDGNVDFEDIKNFKWMFSNNPNNLPSVQNDQEPTEDIFPAQSFFSKPKIYYSRISERVIKRPDGSVERIRTVRDHTGKEETTVIHDYPNPVNPEPPIAPKLGLGDDEAGISIFRKYFPF